MSNKKNSNSLLDEDTYIRALSLSEFMADLIYSGSMSLNLNKL